VSDVAERLPKQFVGHDGRVLFTPEFLTWACERYGKTWLLMVFPRAAYVAYYQWSASDWHTWERHLRANAKSGWCIAARQRGERTAILFVDPCEAALFVLTYDGPRS